MHLILTVAAVFVLALGIYFGQRNEVESEASVSQQKNDVLSTEEEVGDEDETASPTVSSQTNTPSPAPSSPPSSNTSLDEWRYPNASIISSTNNSISLESGDTPEQITDWYRQKIIDLDMSVTTFVTTTTNDNVLNKLAGADSDREVNIEIQRNAGQSITSIGVSLE